MLEATVSDFFWVPLFWAYTLNTCTAAAAAGVCQGL
jgi:hypothetical protein